MAPRHPVPGVKGRRLTWNPVYAHGTERSAKIAAGYRLGMTMTEWACRSLLGLGQTEHLELGSPIPALLKAFKDPKKKLPDLWGHHETEQLYWLIEAKGGDVGLKKLREGWEQLTAGSKVLGAYGHRTVLVGASVRPDDDLFLTIDHDLHPGQPPLAPAGSDADDEAAGPGNLEDRLGDSDDALIGAARAQMLAYLALRSAPAAQLRTVPVAADRASRRRRSGLTTPLEDDSLTLPMRADARGAAADTEQHALRAGIRSMGLDDFLSCRIPGTEVHLGMSRKLFAACERLHEEDLAIARRTPGTARRGPAARRPGTQLRSPGRTATHPTAHLPRTTGGSPPTAASSAPRRLRTRCSKRLERPSPSSPGADTGPGGRREPPRSSDAGNLRSRQPVRPAPRTRLAFPARRPWRRATCD